MQLNQDNGHWMASVYWRSTRFWGDLLLFFGKRSFDESVLVQKTKQQQQQWRASFFVVTRYWVSRPSFFLASRKKLGTFLDTFTSLFPTVLPFKWMCNVCVCVCACGVHGRNQGREKKKKWMLEWIESRLEFEKHWNTGRKNRQMKWNQSRRIASAALSAFIVPILPLFIFFFLFFLVARLFSLFSLFVCLYVVVCLCVCFLLRLAEFINPFSFSSFFPSSFLVGWGLGRLWQPRNQHQFSSCLFLLLSLTDWLSSIWLSDLAAAAAVSASSAYLLATSSAVVNNWLSVRLWRLIRSVCGSLLPLLNSQAKKGERQGRETENMLFANQ